VRITVKDTSYSSTKLQFSFFGIELIVDIVSIMFYVTVQPILPALMDLHSWINLSGFRNHLQFQIQIRNISAS